MHNCTNPLAKLKPKQLTDDGRQIYCTYPLAEIQPKQCSFVMGSVDEVNCTFGENFNNLALELMTRVALRDDFVRVVPFCFSLSVKRRSQYLFGSDCKLALSH